MKTTTKKIDEDCNKTSSQLTAEWEKEGGEASSYAPAIGGVGTFVRISLVVNVSVLIAVCSVLIAFSSSDHVIYVWGPPTAGRGILLSVYFAILVVSIFLLGLHLYCAEKSAIEHMVVALLAT